MLSQVYPKHLKTQLFNMIEQNQTDELIEFISNHTEYAS